MSLKDPVAVYTAASNLQAHCLCQMLLVEGIAAAVVEDESRVGAWMFGLLPGIHKPQVWVERSDVERAGSLLAAFESAEAADEPDGGPLIAVVCEECRRTTMFAGARRGHVEVCSSCGAYVDVGEEEDDGSWRQPSE
jgi:Putative prokaryotic signal transducing protein